MHEGIDQAFRKNGISIPFPQRDLHVRSIDEDVSFNGSGNGKGGSKDGGRKEPAAPAASEARR
jgi:small-conductance mechanosensitive channel